jgi:hypothetical protein
MKHAMVLLALLGTIQIVAAQERLPREEALKYATAVSADAKQLKGTPIPTDVDTQSPVALREGEYGGMVLPQKNLSAEALSKAGKDAVTPLGQLWLLKLAPMCNGQAVSAEKLRLVNVQADGGEVTVPQCALGVRRNSADALELLVFGKDKEPLLAVPLKAIESKQDLPIDMDAETDYDSGKVTLKILGKYQAAFRLTELQS